MLLTLAFDLPHRSKREARREEARIKAARKEAKRLRHRMTPEKLAAAARIQGVLRRCRSSALRSRWLALIADATSKAKREAALEAVAIADKQKAAAAAALATQRVVHDAVWMLEARARRTAVALVLLTGAVASVRVVPAVRSLSLRGGGKKSSPKRPDPCEFVSHGWLSARLTKEKNGNKKLNKKPVATTLELTKGLVLSSHNSQSQYTRGKSARMSMDTQPGGTNASEAAAAATALQSMSVSHPGPSLAIPDGGSHRERERQTEHNLLQMNRRFLAERSRAACYPRRWCTAGLADQRQP